MDVYKHYDIAVLSTGTEEHGKNEDQLCPYRHRRRCDYYRGPLQAPPAFDPRGADEEAGPETPGGVRGGRVY